MKIDYLLFFITFIKSYQSSSSLSIALIISCIIAVGFVISGIIWHSKLNKLIKLFLVVGFWCSMGGFYYLSVKRIAYYSAKKNIEQVFTVEQINELKAQYQAQKNIDLNQQALEILDRIKSTFNDSNPTLISVLFGELQNIDVILNNPFIVNESNPSALAPFVELRKSLIELLLEACKDMPDLLNNINTIKQYNEIILKAYCDPVITELYKVIIEEGHLGYIKFFEQLIIKGDSLKLKQLALLPTIELQILDLHLDNVANFEELAINFLLGVSQRAKEIRIEFDAQQYIHLYLPELVKTTNGRKKVVSDLYKLNKMIIIYTDALCDIIENKNISHLKATELDKLIDKQIDSEINNIIREIESNYK